MEKEKVMNSKKLKEWFCKVHDLPIVIFDNPYFYQRIQTLDSLFSSIHKFEIFCKDLQKFPNEQEYFAHYNKVKSDIIKSIKSKPDYNLFAIGNFQINPILPQKDLYTDENDDSAFISVSMRNVDYATLNHYSPAIFDNTENWEQFVSKFTGCQHIINSIGIIKEVFNACDPEKRSRHKLLLIDILCRHLIEQIPNISVYSLSEDEILINLPREYGVGCGFTLHELEETIKNCPIKDIGELVQIEQFDLFKVKGTEGFIKLYDSSSDRIEFVDLAPEIFHQAVKHFYGKKIAEDDLIFYHNGRLVKLLSAIENPWE